MKAKGKNTKAKRPAKVDPVYSAIMAHLEAYRAWGAALEVSSELPEQSNKAAHKKTTRACRLETNAAAALANVVPTTMGGVMALLSHINACSAGQVSTNGGKDYYSVELWPDTLIDDSIKTKRGKPLSMPFAFWILRNIETALRKLDKAGVSA